MENQLHQPLYPVFQKFANAYENCVRSGYSYKTRDVLYEYLLAANRRYQNTRNAEIRDLLLHSWLLHFDIAINKSKGFNIPFKEIDRFFDLIVNQNIVRSIGAKTETASILACLCLVRVSAIKNRHENAITLAAVLTHWKDEVVPLDELTSMENVTNILYGPVCWPLYRGDVKYDSLMPRYLCRAQLPLVIDIAKKPKTSSAPTLDFDLV